MHLLSSLFFIVTLFFATPVHAEKIKAVGTHFNKIFEQDSNGKFHGVAVDILNKIAEKKGLQIEYATYPWKRAQYLVTAGAADILIGPYYTPEREKQMDFLPTPFYSDEMIFYTLKSKPFNWNHNVDTLKKKKVLIIKGWVYGQNFDDIKSKVEVIEAHDLDTAFKMLAAGRGDLLLANERNSVEILDKTENHNFFTKTKVPLSFMQGYFAFSLKYKKENIKKEIQAALLQLSHEGTIKKVNKEYKLSFDPKF